MTDLEQLSRDAAKVLGYPFKGDFWMLMPTADTTFCGRVDRFTQGFCWLHESTEACAEIMVRVLWPEGAHVCGNSLSVWHVKWHGANSFVKNHQTFASLDCDPMQAFRTAVLRALIEVKK